MRLPFVAILIVGTTNILTTITNAISTGLSTGFSNFLTLNDLFNGNNDFIGNQRFGGNLRGQLINLNNGVLTTVGLTTPGTGSNTGALQTLGGISANNKSFFNGIVMPDNSTIKIGNSTLSSTTLSYLQTITSLAQTQLNDIKLIFRQRGSILNTFIDGSRIGGAMSGVPSEEPGFRKFITTSSPGVDVTQSRQTWVFNFQNVYNTTYYPKSSNSTIHVSFSCQYHPIGDLQYCVFGAAIQVGTKNIMLNTIDYSRQGLFPTTSCFSQSIANSDIAISQSYNISVKVGTSDGSNAIHINNNYWNFTITEIQN